MGFKSRLKRDHDRIKIGDLVEVRVAMPYVPVGTYRVTALDERMVHLSAGDVRVGTWRGVIDQLVIVNGRPVDWALEEAQVKEGICEQFRALGQPCPDCEEEAKKSRARVLVQ